MSNFEHLTPEDQLAETPLALMRRFELHKLAIEKGLVSAKAPTPSKEVLLRLLEGQATSEAFGLPTQGVDVDQLSAEEKVALIGKLQADLEIQKVQEADPFGEVPDDDDDDLSDEEKFQFLANETNVMALSKKFHEMFPSADRLPKKVTRDEVLETAKSLLALPEE